MPSASNFLMFLMPDAEEDGDQAVLFLEAPIGPLLSHLEGDTIPRVQGTIGHFGISEGQLFYASERIPHRERGAVSVEADSLFLSSEVREGEMERLTLVRVGLMQERKRRARVAAQEAARRRANWVRCNEDRERLREGLQDACKRSECIAAPPIAQREAQRGALQAAREMTAESLR